MRHFFLFSVFVFISSFILTSCDIHRSNKTAQLHIWWSTSCSHCLQSIPIFEQQIYTKYKDKVDIFLHTLSDSPFDTNIPQNTWGQMEFQKYTDKFCSYIPSWVILDEFWFVLESSCWSEKDLQDMQRVLKNLF